MVSLFTRVCFCPVLCTGLAVYAFFVYVFFNSSFCLSGTVVKSSSIQFNVRSGSLCTFANCAMECDVSALCCGAARMAREPTYISYPVCFSLELTFFLFLS